MNVTYKDGVININDKKIYTDTFYGLGIGNNNVELNQNNDTFIQEQQHLRALDMMKDGSVDTNISNSIYSIAYPDKELQLPYTKLKNLEDKFIDFFYVNKKIKKYPWTRLNKESKLYPLLPHKTIFKESGLDSKYFIDNPNFVMNFANEVIDQAPRSNYTQTDIIFPPNNTEIKFDTSFLNFFGFIGCNVNAKRIKEENYEYNIIIDNEHNPILNINSLSSRIDNLTVNWFQGNKSKNMFIANNREINIYRYIKNGLLVCKELGDILQILFMFVWFHYVNHVTVNNSKKRKFTNNANTNPYPYSMSTCDKVVFLQCMLLNLNCILTYGDRDKDGVRLRNIMVYEAKEETITDAINRFHNEKNKIYEDNAKFINCISIMADNPLDIFISGDDNPNNFSSTFYRDIQNDMESINKMLNKLQMPKHKDINDVNQFITVMKANFKLNIFIRKTQNKMKILQNMNYTNKTNLWDPTFKTKLKNYGKYPFYLIGRSFYLNNQDIHIESFNGGVKSAESNFINNSYIFLEFEDAPVMYYDKDNIEYNLLDTLKQDIIKKLHVNNIPDIYFDDFYNEILYYFYLMDTVLYDNKLNKLINIIKKIFVIRITPGIPTNINKWFGGNKTRKLNKNKRKKHNKTKSNHARSNK